MGYGRDPAAVPRRAAAGAAGDHGRAAGRDRVDGRADHGRRDRGVRRAGQHAHRRRSHRIQGADADRQRAVRAARRRARRAARGRPAAADAVDPRTGRPDDRSRDAWTTSPTAQLARRRRHAHPAASSSCCSRVTALVDRDAGRAADRAVAGPPRPRRLPGHQHLQHRPGGPDLRGAACCSARPRRAPRARAVRSRRAGDPGRAGAVRAAADHHQRVRRRCARSTGDKRRGGRAAWA